MQVHGSSIIGPNSLGNINEQPIAPGAGTPAHDRGEPRHRLLRAVPGESRARDASRAYGRYRDDLACGPAARPGEAGTARLIAARPHISAR